MEQRSFLKKIYNDSFTWKDSIIITMILFAILYVLGSIISFPIDTIFWKLSDGGSNGLIATLSDYLTYAGDWIAFLLFCLIVKSHRPLLKIIGTKLKGNRLSMLLVGLLIGFVTNTICIVGAILHHDIYLYFDSFPVIPIILIFISIFIQSSAEELFCRGFIYQRLRKAYRNPWVAILLNPIVFMLVHIFNSGLTALALLNIYLVGVFFSIMIYYCDSMWMAMAAHAAWNFNQNIVFGLPNSGYVSRFSIFKLDAATAADSTFYNVAFGVESTVTAMVIFILGIIILTAIGIKKGLRPTEIWQQEK